MTDQSWQKKKEGAGEGAERCGQLIFVVATPLSKADENLQSPLLVSFM